MRKLLTLLIVALIGVACDKEEDFVCRIVDSEATNITTTAVTLEATINASDFSKVERVGFMVDNEFHRAELGRVFSVDIDGLKPNRTYEYRVVVYAVGDVRAKPLRQVVTAVSDGAVAVHMAEEYLSL